MKNKKSTDMKKIFIIAGIVVIMVIIVICYLVLFKGGSNSNEDTLNKNLEKLGRMFYEDFYYVRQEQSQDDIKEFIAKFEKTGIKVNLENISKISTIDKKLMDSMVNSKTKEKCDVLKTNVTIYPTSPYGKKDYKIETKLECGFNK